MKRYLFYGALLVMMFSLSVSCSYIKFNAKDHSPPVEQVKHTQAVLSAAQVTPDKKSRPLFRLLKKYRNKIIALLGLLWLWLLARFYITEKNRRIPRWRLEDLALLKIIKTNALRLWNNHRPGKNVIRLEDWKRDT